RTDDQRAYCVRKQRTVSRWTTGGVTVAQRLRIDIIDFEFYFLLCKSHCINTRVDRELRSYYVVTCKVLWVGNRFKKRLALEQSGINGLDSACRDHDIAYEKNNSLSERNAVDSVLEERAWSRVLAKDANFKEKAAAWLLTTAMKAKCKIGAGCGFVNIVKACKKALKKSVKAGSPTQNMGKLIKSAALGTLSGGVANIVRTLRGIRSGNQSPIFLGKGMYLSPHKGGGSYAIVKKCNGRGSRKRAAGGKSKMARRKKEDESDEKIIKDKKLILPNRALFDFEIVKYAKYKKIPHFRDVYSIDRLPATPKYKETAVVNLDFEKNNGTHWVCYRKIGKPVHYYDSFGNIRPPLQLEKYFKGFDIEYNYEREQAYNTFNCGHFGSSAELECYFFPPIEVGNKSKIGLLSIQTYNSIPNVGAGCDTLHIIHSEQEEAIKIKIPSGYYEIISLEAKIRELLEDIGVLFFSLSADISTLKCTLHCNCDIDLDVKDSIAPLLGFDKRTLMRNRRHESDRVVKIMNVNTIKVECNLALGSFDNGQQSHSIHEFYPDIPPGYEIVEIPKYCVLL
ncbi:Uncharacterized protein FWK35_00034198, partial [Aphis craccivora]